jgi:protein-tyrosine phosphatase
MESKNANRILKGIWLGNCYVASDINFIKNNNIKAIINISKTCITSQYSDIEYLNIPIEEHEVNIYDVINIFRVTNKFIFNKLKDGKNILVHCSKGHTRSASVVGAFIINYLDCSFEKTRKYIQSKRKNTLRDNKLMTKALYKYYLLIHK